MHSLRLTINGQPEQLQVQPTTLLVDLLRNQLGLTGTHIGCDTAQCGGCAVLMDGQAVKSCSMLALQAAGTQVTTIEGLAPVGTLHPVQEAFVACHGLQCGYCTPGMVMSTCGLLQKIPNPSEAQIHGALEGNLCRCTGYVNIVASVRAAATAMARSAA
jgi:aerobic carbon-monoxide dehydrogenase small subunit